MDYFIVKRNGHVFKPNGHRSSHREIYNKMLNGGYIFCDFSRNVSFVPYRTSRSMSFDGLIWGNVVNVRPKEIKQASISDIVSSVRSAVPETASVAPPSYRTVPETAPSIISGTTVPPSYREPSVSAYSQPSVSVSRPSSISEGSKMPSEQPIIYQSTISEGSIPSTRTSRSPSLTTVRPSVQIEDPNIEKFKQLKEKLQKLYTFDVKLSDKIKYADNINELENIAELNEKEREEMTIMITPLYEIVKSNYENPKGFVNYLKTLVKNVKNSFTSNKIDKYVVNIYNLLDKSYLTIEETASLRKDYYCAQKQFLTLTGKRFQAINEAFRKLTQDKEEAQKRKNIHIDKIQEILDEHPNLKNITPIMTEFNRFKDTEGASQEQIRKLINIELEKLGARKPQFELINWWERLDEPLTEFEELGDDSDINKLLEKYDNKRTKENYDKIMAVIDKKKENTCSYALKYGFGYEISGKSLSKSKLLYQACDTVDNNCNYLLEIKPFNSNYKKIIDKINELGFSPPRIAYFECPMSPSKRDEFIDLCIGKGKMTQKQCQEKIQNVKYLMYIITEKLDPVNPANLSDKDFNTIILTLGVLHDKGIVYDNININHIIKNNKTGTFYLINFDKAELTKDKAKREQDFIDVQTILELYDNKPISFENSKFKESRKTLTTYAERLGSKKFGQIKERRESITSDFSDEDDMGSIESADVGYSFFK